jgi:AraC-like DNA-binding protein
MIRVFRQYTQQSPRQYRKAQSRGASAAAAAAARSQQGVIGREHGPRERA